MRISAARANYPKGAAAIVYASVNSPYIGGYRFDALNTTNPWKAKYANPSHTPTVSGLNDRNSAIAVAPSNRHVLYGANGCSALTIYQFDTRLGFTSGLDKSETNAGEFSSISGILFSQDEQSLLVSSTVPSNAAEGSVVTSYPWDSSASGSAVVGSRNWAHAAGNFIQFGSQKYDITSISTYQTPELQSGPDEFVVITCSHVPTAGIQQTLRTLQLNTGAVEDVLYYPNPTSPTTSSSDASGQLLQPVAISPIPATFSGLTASTMIAVGHYNTDSYLSATDIQDGVNNSFNHDSRNSLLPSYSTQNTARYCMFDPYGRLIIAQSDSPYLQIYTQDFTNGQFTLLDTFSSWAGGTINSLAYDKDQDVLFVASQSAPYITAFRMSKSGFDLKYPDMTPSIPNAGGSVVRMSLVYDEDWKSYNA